MISTVVRAPAAAPMPVAVDGLDELPERRREQLLWRFAPELDYLDVDEWVREKSRVPCRWEWPPALDRVAVLGDDGRFHLCTPDGRPRCGRPRVTPGPYRHTQLCHWWSDRDRYRIQPPQGVPSGQADGRTVRWSVALTSQQLDPALVPWPQRCPVDAHVIDWPAVAGGTGRIAQVRGVLIAALGAACHACGRLPGVQVDHDHFTGRVRGLLCRPCNSQLEGCPHRAGCPWADYLNDPPADGLNLRYPAHDGTRRNARWKVELLGIDPFDPPLAGRPTTLDFQRIDA